MFKHILVATDGSDISQKCVEKAVSFAKETSAKLSIFYAKPADPSPYIGLGSFTDARTIQAIKEQYDNLTTETLEKAQAIANAVGLECTTHSELTDSPYEGIIKCAEQQGCDVIFMASHGRSGVSSLLLGSETQKVLSHSKLPVLVYR